MNSNSTQPTSGNVPQVHSPMTNATMVPTGLQTFSVGSSGAQMPTLQLGKSIQIINTLTPGTNLTLIAAPTGTHMIDAAAPIAHPAPAPAPAPAATTTTVKTPTLKINQMTSSAYSVPSPLPVTVPISTPVSTVTTSNSTMTPNTTSSNASTSALNASNANLSSSSYGGFAYCSNCGEYGVKAAFYGKSKLYCSVACQNGIKKQQQHQNQGVKRTAESLSFSPTSATISQPILVPTQSATAINQPSPITLNNFTITIANATSGQQVVTNSKLEPKLVQTPSPAPGNTVSSYLSQSASAAATPTATAFEVKPFCTTPPLTSAGQSSPASGQNPAKRARKTSTSSNLGTSSFPMGSGELSKSFSGALSTTLGQAINAINTTLSAPVASVPLLNATTEIPSISVSIPPLPAATTTEPVQVSPTNSNSTIMANKSSHTKTSPKNNDKFNWPTYIERTESVAAPVYAFKHVPLAGFWRKMMTNTRLEVPNRDPPPDELIDQKDKQCSTRKCYWFASVVQFAGYYVKLRYLGYDDDASDDFWLPLFSEDVKSIGWCSDNNVALVPPFKIAYKHDDWHGYIMKSITGNKTVPQDFHQRVKDSLLRRFKTGMRLEIIDKKKLSSMCLAKIIENIGGRLRIKYENKENFDDFWCHEMSELIHPIGWSAYVGHPIEASDEYVRQSGHKYLNHNYQANECTPSMFKKKKSITFDKQPTGDFRVGMKLEAVDPLNLKAICVATVGKVLSENYLLVKIDGVSNVDSSDMFCYHRTSSFIFPAGFCQKNNLPLQSPYNYKGDFNWETYLKETNSEYAPVNLFYNDVNMENPFKVGMKLESVDLMEPRMICVATVVAVVNRLIKLNFDGWESEYDQWMDFESCDIYPVGWCELVGYRLEDPPNRAEIEKRPLKSSKKLKLSN